MRYDSHPFTTSPKGSAIWTASRNSLITQGDPTQHLVLTFSVFIRIIILCYVVKNYARLPRNKLVIKIYVMENIYHYKITAIVEEMFVKTVTNARQGLNVLPFDLKRAINETIRGASELFPSWFLLLLRRPSFLTLYIPDKWLWILSTTNKNFFTHHHHYYLVFSKHRYLIHTPSYFIHLNQNYLSTYRTNYLSMKKIVCHFQ